MKNIGYLPRRRTAFTLIELIVVIAIIGLLAAMIFPIAGAVNRHKQIGTAQTQLQAMSLAIDSYKSKLGFYPPDNTNNPVFSPLYYELIGTTNDGVGTTKQPTLWVATDGSAQIGTTTAPKTINDYYGVFAFANSSTRARSDDNGSAAGTFINNLTPNQIGLIDPGDRNSKILVCAVTWPLDRTPAPVPLNPAMNPWRYVSSHPTNNTGSYDLWVDLIIAGKTNRVCNWSTQPIKL
jgi:prepilin-type N-terminal cleavage/methylation domain-containing protein